MKQTVLHPKHVALNGKMVEFAGYHMPISYTSITEEHEYVRTKCGLFDVSHMGEICFRGKDAAAFVDYLFTNDALNMEKNQVLYGMMCYPDGGVVDDLLVYKFEEDHFVMVVNASNIDKDYDWVVSHNTFDCDVLNQSDKMSEVALQGPYAETLLQQLVEEDLSTLAFFHSRQMTINGDWFLVSRTGYTGEDGFEIYGANHDINDLWDVLLETGGPNIAPIGLGARDTLRFEVALPLYGNELSKDITPLEAGLGFAVKLDAGDFIGKEALVAQKETGTTRRICGLELLDKGIIRHGYPIYSGDQHIGEVTTGYKSPSLGKTVALAMIDRPFDTIGTTLDVLVRGNRKKVVVSKKKFYNKKYKK